MITTIQFIRCSIKSKSEVKSKRISIRLGTAAAEIARAAILEEDYIVRVYHRDLLIARSMWKVPPAYAYFADQASMMEMIQRNHIQMLIRKHRGDTYWSLLPPLSLINYSE